MHTGLEKYSGQKIEFMFSDVSSAVGAMARIFPHSLNDVDSLCFLFEGDPSNNSCKSIRV